MDSYSWVNKTWRLVLKACKCDGPQYMHYPVHSSDYFLIFKLLLMNIILLSRHSAVKYLENLDLILVYHKMNDSRLKKINVAYLNPHCS